jgi:hypothetical protein
VDGVIDSAADATCTVHFYCHKLEWTEMARPLAERCSISAFSLFLWKLSHTAVSFSGLKFSILFLPPLGSCLLFFVFFV